MNTLLEVQSMPIVQITYPEACWTIPAITCAMNTMEQIHINFVIEPPEDDGYGKNMICMDYFSKIVVLLPL